MNDTETQNLLEELEHFRKEKEKIRQLVGQIGGKGSGRTDKAINIIFFVSIILLFIMDIFRHIFHFTIPLAPLFSIELGLLLVSIKIIWMMHKQAKVEHFQFWILNSIEFRLNDISKRLQIIERNITDGNGK